MAEQIIINIVRPEVGVEYVPESQEAQPADQLAACELALHALGRRGQDLCAALHRPCPEVVANLVRSDLWRHGM